MTELKANGLELPSWHALQALETLSRLHRIGAAAEKLGLSHAAVSQTLSRLEKKYGVVLFNKTSWGLEPTPACRRVIEAYEEASSSLGRAVLVMATGDYYQVALPCSAWSWLASSVSDIASSLPMTSYRLFPETGAPGLETADFALAPSEDLPPAGFDGAPLFDERVVPVASPAFLKNNKVETPAALVQQRLLVSDRDLWVRWFRHAGLTSEPGLDGPAFADPAMAFEAAIRGQGVALLCSIAAAAACKRGDLLTPVDISLATGRRYWAVWRRDEDRRESVARLTDWILAALQSLASKHVSIVESARRPARA